MLGWAFGDAAVFELHTPVCNPSCILLQVIKKKKKKKGLTRLDFDDILWLAIGSHLPWSSIESLLSQHPLPGPLFKHILNYIQ